MFIIQTWKAKPTRYVEDWRKDDGLLLSDEITRARQFDTRKEAEKFFARFVPLCDPGYSWQATDLVIREYVDLRDELGSTFVVVDDNFPLLPLTEASLQDITFDFSPTSERTMRELARRSR